MEPLHRFHNVPNENRWRPIFAAWRNHLRTIRDHTEDHPWAYSERTNVGLFASGHDKDGGVSMVEIPLTRRTGESDEGVGRYDLWLGRGKWEAYAEAKMAWAPSWGSERVDHAIAKLNEAGNQALDLKKMAADATVATLVFVVPYPSWTSTTDGQAVYDRFLEFERQLWERHDKRSRTFQTSFALRPDEIKPVDSDHARPRAFPGVILCGRIHNVGIS